MMLWSWRVVRGRPRLFIGLLCGLAALPLIPGDISRTTRAVLAWDFGVIVFLVSAAFLFTTERLDRMAEDAEAQEEGEWTVFWLTVAAVTFSFVAVIDEFAGMKDLPPGAAQPACHSGRGDAAGVVADDAHHVRVPLCA